MKAKSITEIRATLSDSDFQAWFTRRDELRKSLETTRVEFDEVDTQYETTRYRYQYIQRKAEKLVFEAGECIDQSARAQADFASVENDSFQLLSDFESQSQMLQDAIIARDQIEKALEGDRLESSGISGGAAQGSKDLSSSIGASAKELQSANDLVERRQTELNSAWVKVEGTWERSFTSNMARSEFSYQARRLHRQAELTFREAKELKSSMQYLGEKRDRLADSQESLSTELEEHQRTGAEKFDCSIISDFLFWAHETDVHAAVCVPLIDEFEHFNIQIHAKKVYLISQEKGLDFIEPLPEEEMGEEDPRLQSFFTEGRAA